MNYYVYIGLDSDYSRTGFSLYSLIDERIVISELLYNNLNGIQKLLYRIHVSKKVNSVFKLPFKSVWNKYILDRKTKSRIKNGNVCFIFNGTGYAYREYSLFSWLRKNYVGCKIIYIFPDRVDYYFSRYSDFSIEYLYETFDYVFTYNRIDSLKYGIELQPAKICEAINDDIDAVDIDEFDIFFVGIEKGRLDEILNIYERCRMLGLKCNFNIMGVPKEKRKYERFINYDRWLTYEEVLKNDKKTKCVLNIIQDGASGITLRDSEAIALGKTLLTNNSYLKETALYTPEKIVFLDDLETEVNKIIENDDTKPWNNLKEHSYSEYFKWLEKKIWPKEFGSYRH